MGSNPIRATEEVIGQLSLSKLVISNAVGGAAPGIVVESPQSRIGYTKMRSQGAEYAAADLERIARPGAQIKEVFFTVQKGCTHG